MRLIDAVTAAEVISKELHIPIDDLDAVFADVPTVEIRTCDNCGSEKCARRGYINPREYCYGWGPRQWLTEYCPNCGAEMRGGENGKE